MNNAKVKAKKYYYLTYPPPLLSAPNIGSTTPESRPSGNTKCVYEPATKVKTNVKFGFTRGFHTKYQRVA